MPETTRLAQTIQTWWPAILNALTEGVTNARTEGFNRISSVRAIGLIDSLQRQPGWRTRAADAEIAHVGTSRGGRHGDLPDIVRLQPKGPPLKLHHRHRTIAPSTWARGDR